jgi:hypothetical protein
MPSITELNERERPAEVGAPSKEYQAGLREWRAKQPGFIELLRRIQNGEDRRSLYPAAGACGLTEHQLGQLFSAGAVLRDERRLVAAQQFPAVQKEKEASDARLADVKVRYENAPSEAARKKIAEESREVSTEHQATIVRWAEARSASKALAAARELGFQI